MEQQVSRMAAEVNKLIGGSLLAGNDIYLPEIGSLKIEQDNQGVKSILFSSEEQGTSLVEVIKERAGCTTEQAVEIFGRWKKELYFAEHTIIAGVGSIDSQSFKCLDSFEAQLNSQPEKTEPTMEPTTPTPVVEATAAAAATTQKQAAPTPAPAPKPQPQEPKEEKKESNKTLILCIILILIAAGCYFGYRSISASKAEKAQIEAIAQAKAAEQQRVADSIALAHAEAQRAAEANIIASKDNSPRYKVVYGIYELRSNVDVAIAHINAKYGANAAHEYPFRNGLTLVSMFESNDRSECQKFLMRDYEEYPDMWVYDSQQ